MTEEGVVTIEGAQTDPQDMGEVILEPLPTFGGKDTQPPRPRRNVLRIHPEGAGAHNGLLTTHRLVLKGKLAKLAVQRSAMDTQPLGGQRTIPLRLGEGLKDDVALRNSNRFFERSCACA